MNKFTALAGTGLLLAGSAAFAQDTSSPADPADPLPDAATSAPMDSAPVTEQAAPAGELPADSAAQSTSSAPELSAEAAPATGEAAFTDAQIQSFAAAALEIQNLTGDDAAKQEQAAAIVAQSGIDAATFNAIGQAMQTNPEVAERVQLAAAGMQGQPEG